MAEDPRLHYRRLARYLRRTQRATARLGRVARASDVALRRLGDGIKPNHTARAVQIADVFPPVETDQ